MTLRRPVARTPFALLIAILLAYVGVSLCVGWQPGFHSWAALRRPAADGRLLLLVVTPALAGVFRVWTVHPRFQPAYAAWLGTTPWRPGRPLPLGPVVWSWEDLAVLLVLSLLARFDAGLLWYTPVVPYVLGRLGTASVATDRTDAFGILAVIGFVFPLLAFAWRWEPALVATLAALVLLDTLALRRSLAGFPWVPADPSKPAKRGMPGPLTWPTNLLGPVPPPPSISTPRGVCFAALDAWWGWVPIRVLAGLNVPLETSVLSPGLPLIGVIVAGVRVGLYCGHYFPPIGPLGRLLTGRWIMWGYDRVLVGPLSVVAAAWAVPAAVVAIGGSSADAVAATFFAITAIALLAGPSRRSWERTGHHRIHPGLRPTARPASRRRLSLTRT